MIIQPECVRRQPAGKFFTENDMEIHVSQVVIPGDTSAHSNLNWCYRIDNAASVMYVFPYQGNIIHNEVKIVGEDDTEIINAIDQHLWGGALKN